MLVKLLIKNYALIDNSEINFHAGLNIITGETGAGKSILMGALGLILGSRAEGKQFFDDSKKCVIEGYFDLSSYELRSFFDENDLDYELETIIRRELTVDGKSRAFVNDSPVNLTVLRTLGEKLVDIHSQHATLQITKEDFQLLVLDSIANNQVDLMTFRSEWKVLRNLDVELLRLKDQIYMINSELDYNQFLYEELEKLNIGIGEINELEEEQRKLENAEEIKLSLLASNQFLSDNEYSVLNLLKDSIQQISIASKYLPHIASLSERLESAYIDIKDVSEEVLSEEQDIHVDEQKLNDINTRLSDAYNLLKKHRVESDEELIEVKKVIEEKLQIASNQDEVLTKLEEQRAKQFAKVLELTRRIHIAREKVLPVVEAHVGEVLTSVGMPNAQLIVKLDKLNPEDLNNNGQNAVSFLFTANKGQSPQAIQKVASGGELSRVMLAIKSLVAKSSALPSIVFDEIDTGISGEVALKVGSVMQDLSAHMQVIAITHLPQIASLKGEHFKVSKGEKEDKAYSQIKSLTKEERILEIAQMLSGATPGEAALKHAKDLLQN